MTLTSMVDFLYNNKVFSEIVSFLKDKENTLINDLDEYLS